MKRSDAPGLMEKKRRGRIVGYYWVARRASSKAAGYEPKTVRLHYDTPEERASRCRILTAELLEWLARTDAPDEINYDGTIRSLIRAYQTDPDSPYQEVKESTRQRDYDPSLRIVEAAVGTRRVDALTMKDFKRWHRKFAEPAEEGGERRPRRAHGAITALRMIFKYGSTMNWQDCRIARSILSDMRFKRPERRREALNRDQAASVIEEAISRGQLSLALAQALQFELSLRQIDVIGEWLKTNERSGIVYNGRRWTNGLTWSNVSPDLILIKRTSKTDARGEWNLRLFPLVMKVLDLIPDEQRIGPMIVSESHGRPYRSNDYQKHWRRIARAVGIPDHVWNMDSRAGGISEADEAGADPRDLQAHATHEDFKTTQRYIRSTTLNRTSRIADLKARARKPPGSNRG